MSDLREQLLAIREAAGGRLTPQAVVDAARPSDHPLHSQFEWDDAVAGEKFRRDQARQLIRRVKVVYAPEDAKPFSSVRAFHAIRVPNGAPSYEPLDEILDNPLITEMLKRDMERDWRALRGRWERFIEFWDLVRNDLEQTG